MFYELMLLGFVCILVPWLARLAGFETGRKAFDIVGLGGIFFLIAGAFTLGIGTTTVLTMGALAKTLTMVWFYLGMVALIIGAVWETIEVVREPDHTLAHKML